jgi:hypothetical protein
MKRTIYCVCILLSLTLAAAEAEKLLPEVVWKPNEAYLLKSLCGRYGWQNGIERNNGQKMMFQQNHTENSAIWGYAPGMQKIGLPEDRPLLEKRLELFRAHKLPALGRMYIFFDKQIPYPTSEELAELAANPGFLGFRSINEWGTQLDRLMKICFHPETVREAASLKMMPKTKDFFPPDMKEPKTREEYTAAAQYLWTKSSAPFDGQVHVLDGSHYWAKAWPGGWGKIRSIITENRLPYRSNSITQAISRGAARMWNVPYGFLQAYDWHARIGHPTFSHMQTPRDAYRNQQGLLKINPNLYRRLWYYQLMGNAAFIGDESDQNRYADWSGSGQFRLSWYGELCEEVREFNDLFPDLGAQYNPVGLLLGWHNGWAYRGDKAFYLFPYNQGEHMTREIIHRAIFCFSENRAPMDEFGPMPYGDLFDILRFDTPKGALPQKLLENYRVLFLVGDHPLAPEHAKALMEYVHNGGVLVINAAHKLAAFPTAFLGAEPGKQFSSCEIITPDGNKLSSGDFLCTELTLAGGRKLYADAEGRVSGVINDYGKGRVITMGMHYLLETTPVHDGKTTNYKLLTVANDLLRRLTSELLPFQLTGEHLDERLAYQINRKPDGWVIAFYNNAGRFAAGKAYHGYIGPDVVDINQSVSFKMRLAPQLKHAVSLLNGKTLYPEGTSTHRELEFLLEPGEFDIIEIAEKEIPPPTLQRPVNLAYNAAVSATTSTPGHGAEKAVDGDEDFLSAWWGERAAGDSLTVDLGEKQTVHAIRLLQAWSYDNTFFPRICCFKVEAKLDEENWLCVVDESRNIMPESRRGVYRRFEPVQTRYLRVTILSNSSRQGAQVIEFQAFGDRMETVTVPWEIDPSKMSFPQSVQTMSKREYLSAGKIPLISQKQDEKPPAMDRACYHLGELSIRGSKFSRGIGGHAKSELVFKLNPADEWKFFTAYVGIDDSSNPVGTVAFRVFVDGKLAADSGKLTMKYGPVPIFADVSGAQELKLVIDDCGDGIQGDIANWCDACLRK